MLEHHSPTHSCDPTVLCGVGAGILSVLHSDLQSCYYVIRVFHVRLIRCATHSYHSCASSRTPAIFIFIFIRVGCATHFVSFNRVRVGWSSLNSYVIECSARHQVSIVQAIAHGGPGRGIQSVRRTSTYVIMVYQAVVSSGCQPVFNSVSNSLAGALWGIKCDKQAPPLRPVF
jgi:hypothetical protein